MRRILSFLLVLAVVVHLTPAFALRQPELREGSRQILSGLEESLEVPPADSFGSAGLEEITTEKVLTWAITLDTVLQDPLNKMREELAYLPTSWEGWNDPAKADLIRRSLEQVLLESGRFVRLMRQTPEGIEGMSPIFSKTISHELGNPTGRLCGYSELALLKFTQGGSAEVERFFPTTPPWVAIQRGLKLMEAVLQELTSSELLRLVTYQLGSQIVLRVSNMILPGWSDLNRFPTIYGRGLAHESQRLTQPGIDQFALIPLTPVGGETIHLRTYLDASVAAQQEEIASYFEEGNRLFQETEKDKGGLPVQFDAPVSISDPNVPLNTLGVLIYEGEKPQRAVPEGYVALSVDQLRQLHPGLVAAKILHPKLSWEFLERYQVKGLLLLQDDTSGARYLALLA